jgi:hypothetical protein
LAASAADAASVAGRTLKRAQAHSSVDVQKYGLVEFPSGRFFGAAFGAHSFAWRYGSAAWFGG